VQSPFDDYVLSGVGPVLHRMKDGVPGMPAKSNAILKSRCSLQPEITALRAVLDWLTEGAN